jgi:hypothetical protein
MIIEEKDFKIVCKLDNYTLHLFKYNEQNILKSSIGGYYTQLRPALKEVYNFRKSEEYTGTQSAEEISNSIQNLIKIEEHLLNVSDTANSAILKLKIKVGL